MNVNKQNKSSIITSRETFQSENNYAIDREINENPPNWIEGDWAVTTSYGSFGVKFKGKRMRIVDINGTMRSGSYRYDSRQHIIYPDFEPTYYELDIINHRIYAGNGLYFHRI